jgi:NADH:ubiquinone oxidoreductase subunit C
VREKLRNAERYGPSRPIAVFPIDNADGTFDLIYMFQHGEEVVTYRYKIKPEDEIESLSDLWKGVLNMERENIDLFGMRFKGVEGGLFLVPGSGVVAPLRKPLQPKEGAKPEAKEVEKDG